MFRLSWQSAREPGWIRSARSNGVFAVPFSGSYSNSQTEGEQQKEKSRAYVS